MTLQNAVLNQHASEDVKFHCLYAYYYVGITQLELSKCFTKNPSTISRWVNRYAKGQSLSRKVTKRLGRINTDQVNWIISFFTKNPTAYLAECKEQFKETFFPASIAVSTIYGILHKSNFSRKVVERRALQIKVHDIIRFTRELNFISWMKHQLVFLDEVSFDNRGMLRKYGYCVKGERLVIKGEFTRKARVSYLAFINQCGVLDYYRVDGTFNRSNFVQCVKDLAINCKKIRGFPGYNSIWIMDGAKIHTHPDVVNMLRSLGIIVIFLPAYCPFYNPIEFLFGMMKNDFRKYYTEGKNIALDSFINRIFDKYAYYDFSRIFRKCGYETSCQFNPGCAEILCDEFFAEDDDQPIPDMSINRENETPELTTVQIALDNEAQSTQDDVHSLTDFKD